MLQVWLAGLYSRIVSASILLFVAGLSTMNSSITALPPRMFVVVCVPAYSTQVVDPVSGLTRRFRSAFQLPTIQSKSWRPSRGAGPVASDGAAEAVCAPAGQAMASPIATRPMARNGTNARTGEAGMVAAPGGMAPAISVHATRRLWHRERATFDASPDTTRARPRAAVAADLRRAPPRGPERD